MENIELNEILHPLEGVVELPKRFNNPFYYEPDALCRRAMDELIAYLQGDDDGRFLSEKVSPEFRSEIARGKMFGVLVVEIDATSSHCVARRDDKVLPQRRLAYLAGYSGQIGGCADWAGFVPAVFDYLQPEGYFKREEAEIVKLNRQMESLPKLPRWEDVEGGEERPKTEKGRREGETEEEYIARRQFENGELHRWKLRERERREGVEAKVRQIIDKKNELKTLRRKRSDALQTWLFRRFVMRNAMGEERDLISIFGTDALPPAGSGECCEPRLLQYAFAHGLRPVSMAMFWWGESPREEVRHHLQCYPACRGKCRPILQWMLRGMEVEPNPLNDDSRQTLHIVYEDDVICVVDKPSGMLAVPGKGRRESVLSLMQERCGDGERPMVVHRLDMATSGLMIVAKTIDAYRHLQRQFMERKVSKRYVALLTRDMATKEGTISLPLRPDLNDRPRQMVDEQFGKPAETRYEKLAPHRVALYPHTGRTHQLRVHCAHKLGLDNPIKGDRLYGAPADRLYLHAEQLCFRHPTTGKEMKLTAEAPF